MGNQKIAPVPSTDWFSQSVFTAVYPISKCLEVKIRGQYLSLYSWENNPKFHGVKINQTYFPGYITLQENEWKKYEDHL